MTVGRTAAPALSFPLMSLGRCSRRSSAPSRFINAGGLAQVAAARHVARLFVGCLGSCYVQLYRDAVSDKARRFRPHVRSLKILSDFQDKIAALRLASHDWGSWRNISGGVGIHGDEELGGYRSAGVGKGLSQSRPILAARVEPQEACRAAENPEYLQIWTSDRRLESYCGTQVNLV